MRTYSISMMVISSFITIVVVLCFFVDLIKFSNPEIAVEGHDYKKYISLEFFKQQEMKSSIDSKYGPDLTKLTEADWGSRWGTFKNVTLMEEKHDSKVDMVQQFIWIVAFIIIFLAHFFLYRRCERKGM